MTDLLYHIAQPENVKATYEELNNVDFRISGPGRALLAGSVRLVGDVIVTANTSFVADGSGNLNRVMYDGFIGAHSFVDTVTTSFSTSGQVENIRFYPRYVAAKAKASIAPSDLYNSVYTPEQRTPNCEHADLLLKGFTVDPTLGAFDAALTRPMDFSLKLDCCINNPMDNNMISFDKNGDLTLSLTVARSVYVLYGDPAIGNTKVIELSNLRLMYSTVADLPKPMPIQLKVETDLKQSIQSSNAVITTKAPIVANAFFITFVRQQDENTALVNGMEGQRLPNVRRVEYTWNDSLSNQYRYELESEEEFLSNYIKAVNMAIIAENNASLNVLASNDSYGLGLSFGSFVDLSQSKIGIRIDSDVSNTDPYTAYMFFTGVITL
jgi:hypothetical protein